MCLLPVTYYLLPITCSYCGYPSGFFVDTCWVNYSNIEILSKDGTWHIPHIAMAHELIHCWHTLNGLSNPNMKQEEYQTVGIKGFDSLPVTENKLRYEAGLPLRTKYFADD